MGSDNPVTDIEAEFASIDSKLGWAELYMEIRSESQKNNHTINAAIKSKNKNLNRYRDVSPYDHSRIVLTKGRHDYINANLVKVEKARRQYILTQGPLLQTMGHFWLMVWEQNCKAVVMLNRIIEKNQEKCYQYWPLGEQHGGDNSMAFKDVGLVVEYVSEKEFSYYTVRALRLINLESGTSRMIVHFHYTTWPDFGVPQSPTAFLRFLSVVRRSGALSDKAGPPVVHCSAGIGRSGTFCLVDSCLVLMKENGVNSVKVRDLLMEMRQYRMGLIQTPDQLRFSYQSIIEGISKEWDTANDNDIEVDMLEDLNQNNRASPVIDRLRQEWQNSESEESDDEAGSEEDEDEEGPPPIPPPRTMSLQPNRPLPSEPSTPDSDNNPDPTAEVGLKHREKARAEKNEATAQKVAEMKRKLESDEQWRKLKRSLLNPISLGLGALLIGSSMIIISYYANKA